MSFWLEREHTPVTCFKLLLSFNLMLPNKQHLMLHFLIKFQQKKWHLPLDDDRAFYDAFWEILLIYIYIFN